MKRFDDSPTRKNLMKLPYSPLKTGSSLLTSLLLCSQLNAAPLTWDGGVSGDWVNGGAGWIGGTWSNATPDSAIFSGTSPTSVTINSGGITVDDISVTSGTYSIAGPGTLTLSNTAIDIASSLTTTISAALAGTTGLTKSGAGTLVFTGTNKNYTGTTAINGGAIQISSAAAGALGSTNNGAVSLNGGALHAEFSSNTNVNYAISVGASGGELRNLGGDSGRWQMVSNTISGSGILTLSFGSNNTRFTMGTTTQNSFSGKWVIDSGGNVNRFVDVDGNSTFGNVSGDDAITLQNSGTILFRSTRTHGSGYGITLGSGGGNIVAGGTHDRYSCRKTQWSRGEQPEV
jgi:autotransporter-associated beta strand protein